MLEDWILRKKEIEDSKNNLQGADLCNAKLMQAKLDGASLEDADLTAAYLIKADLSGANLSRADLTQSVLIEADLSGVDFEETELTDTFLNGANLKGALNLTCDQLDLANYDRDTIFPDYIKIKWSPEGYCECFEEN